MIISFCWNISLQVGSQTHDTLRTICLDQVKFKSQVETIAQTYRHQSIYFMSELNPISLPFLSSIVIRFKRRKPPSMVRRKANSLLIHTLRSMDHLSTDEIPSVLLLLRGFGLNLNPVSRCRPASVDPVFCINYRATGAWEVSFGSGVKQATMILTKGF